MISQPIKILLADAHYISRMGIKTTLSRNKDFTITTEVQNSAELIKSVKKYAPDVVIIDYNIPNFFKVEDVSKIKSVSPKTNVLVVSSDHDKQNIHKVLEYGVKNFLTKECDEDEIVKAVYATAQGEKFFCARVIDIILEKHLGKEEEHCEPSVLSQRETEIVKLITQGYTAKRIAARLFLSHHTVSTHRKNILRKLRVKSTSELVLYAIKLGLVSPDK